MIVGGASPEVIKLIKKAYVNNPVFFFFPFYDLMYYPEFTEVYLDVVGNDVVGYLLVWGSDCVAVRLMGNARRLIDKLPTHDCVDIIALISDYDIREFLNVVSGRVGTHLRGVSRVLTMVCTRESFRDLTTSLVRRLGVGDVNGLMSIKGEQGLGINYLEALMRLVSPHWHYYGAFLNGELVSIAAASAKLPEVWYVSDVYTRRGFRNMGFARAVVSAVTRDAINSGAVAMLEVSEDDEASVRAYGDVGYRVVNVEYRLVAKPM
ncbi:GNAT family N-acetyltransferase [Vulcanisaeta thermophila]|uniref:GNAT family N-acetyltransferase n=1 Tax=Vulcanisaeta thermophila TaxID=867917 RepID=UPI0008536C50|nr:GNAT family N-acetyltransferase [Vulcanisaeta thermophila]